MPITGSQTAYKFALANVARAGASRSNYTSAFVFVSIGGTEYATAPANVNQLVLAETLSITESRGSDANTCTFQVRGFTPAAPQEVIIRIGSKNQSDRQFAGVILTVAAGYQDTPANKMFTVTCQDYSWHLTRRRVTKKYTNLSATAIAVDLVSQVPGFTSANVQTGLATIDEISFTGETVLSALTQLANRIANCFVKVLYNKDVLFGTAAESGSTAPVSLTSSNKTADSIQIASDLSHVITRATVSAGGSKALGEVTAGDAYIPVEDPTWFNTGGGTVLCGPQKISYLTVDQGGGGTIAGPGGSPASALAAAVASGAGVTSGTHQYAFTFITAAGETLPSPSAQVITGGSITDPSVAPGGGGIPSPNGTGPYPFVAGDHARLWAYTFVNAVGETLPSPTSTLGFVDPLPAPGPYYAYLTGIAVGPAGTTKRRIYRTVAGGAQLKLVAEIADNSTTNYDDHIADGSLGANAPSSNTTAGNQVALTSIALGPSGVTSRKIYRTVAGGTQLKLLTTIADNTTSTYTDSTADGSLGANAPTSDTSGLSLPTPQAIPPGSTTLDVASIGPFSVTGGWAVIGNGRQVIRYQGIFSGLVPPITGVAKNQLQGIPASGVGSITAPITYGTSVTDAPTLVQTTGLLYAIAKGDPVTVLVQVDDRLAQVALAALIGGSEDGVIEDWQSVDGISETQARDVALATLAQHDTVDLSITGNSRDLNLRACRQWAVNVTNPMSVNATFTIQSVTIANFQNAIPPTRQFQAGALRLSFSDLLRIVEGLTR